MKTKVLLISGIAAGTLLAGGWALAQTQGHSHGANHTQHAHAKGHGQMQHKGHGQKQGMGRGKHQRITQGGPGAKQPGGKTGSAHQH